MNTTPAHLRTTFRLLRQYGACTSGYKKLAQHIRDQHGTSPEDYGMDRPIAIATILESNGQADAFWSLRATQEPSDQFTRLLACDFAEHVLPIFEARRPNDQRPRKAIEVARRFARGQADRDELIAARKGAAAADAAAAAAAYAAYAAAAAADAADADAAAAAYAAYAAAAYAAYAAAAYAANAAAARLNERQWQLHHFKAALAAESERCASALSERSAAGNEVAAA